MKKIFLSVLLISTLQFFGQDCNCLKSINFLENQYEQNLASYQHQVVEYKRQNEYLLHKESINKLAKKINTPKNCIGLVAKYISFFRDEHLSIDYNYDFYKFKSLNDTIIINETFFRETSLQESENKSLDSQLEGIWYFQDGSFAIKIIPNKDFNREWAAIMIQDYSPFWFKGQIKMEFSRNESGQLNCLYWRNKRTPKYMQVNLTDSIMYLGRDFKFYKTIEKAQSKKSTLTNEFQFKQLSDSTTYIRIPSFGIENYKIIDSLVSNNLGAINKSPNLIIDLRGNGGGGDRSYKSLLPLIFDTKIVPNPYTASVWGSIDNFKYYDDTKFDIAETKQDSVDEINYVEKLRVDIGKFQPIKFTTDMLDLVYNNPQKVVLLTNKKCGSTTEGFTMVAKESRKVIQMGENTAGMVSYGDWRPIEIPELPIFVSCTTKKMVFFNNQDIESIGIKPDILLNPENENDWIEEAQKYLKK
jgi:Peptidase family S41